MAGSLLGMMEAEASMANQGVMDQIDSIKKSINGAIEEF